MPPTVSLNAMEEVWQFLNEEETEPNVVATKDQESGDDLMAISVQAFHGTEGSQTIKFRGFLVGKEVFMLLDSGSSHCFISEQTVAQIPGWKALGQSISVRVANGNQLLCTHELPNVIWGLQDQTFQSSFKIIQLGCYDIILGMDWLSQRSPMQIHWAKKWLQFQHKGGVVELQGIQSGTI